MADVLTFDPPVALPHPDLMPWNYIPAALPAITGDPDARNRILLSLPDPELNLNPRFCVIGADTLASPRGHRRLCGRAG